MKKFFILYAAVLVLLLSACTSAAGGTGTLEDRPGTAQTEFTETAPDSTPAEEIADDAPDNEPTCEEQTSAPEPFHFDEYGARYILVEGTTGSYRMDEEYREVIETPESSAISVMSYWYSGAELRVQFRESGTWYVYYDFEPEMWATFKNADSKGRFLNESIKGFYAYERE